MVYMHQWFFTPVPSCTAFEDISFFWGRGWGGVDNVYTPALSFHPIYSLIKTLNITLLIVWKRKAQKKAVVDLPWEDKIDLFIMFTRQTLVSFQGLVSYLVGALSPVNQKGLHHDWKQTSIHLLLVLHVLPNHKIHKIGLDTSIKQNILIYMHQTQILKKTFNQTLKKKNTYGHEILVWWTHPSDLLIPN